jgi:bifunctional UDP-N-acetylglucosamine pyrophosphorylase/glucosamine-1-phosphate N-acetyltransferase
MQESDSSGNLEVVVLAAGQGSRMRSALPKVLHQLGGRSLLDHVLTTVAGLEPTRVHVVIGHGAELVRKRTQLPVIWVEQDQQLGTGHAVSQALPGVDDSSTVLVVYGDVPLVSVDTLNAACREAAEGNLALITAQFSDPAQLGRIVRGPSGSVQAIVEYADASEAQRGITEINSGILALNAAAMKQLLREVQPKNAQGEYYLTDLIELAVQNNIAVSAIAALDPDEVTGINDRVQLAQLERIYQRNQAERLMQAGVTLADPARLDIRGEVTAGPDCYLDINVVLEGQVQLGCGVTIGPGCVIKDSELADGVNVAAHTVIEGAHVGEDCQLGPFARIRPGTVLAEQVKIGNFVETKKVQIGRGSKASHLSYLGDASLGEDCNIGAGTVTCNYDGINKHRTEIGDRVFVGTNSTLVAPLTIDSEAFVAAGSTVTTRVGQSELAVGRGKQRNIKGWVRPDQRKNEGS